MNHSTRACIPAPGTVRRLNERTDDEPQANGTGGRSGCPSEFERRQKDQYNRTCVVEKRSRPDSLSQDGVKTPGHQPNASHIAPLENHLYRKRVGEPRPDPLRSGLRDRAVSRSDLK